MYCSNSDVFAKLPFQCTDSSFGGHRNQNSSYTFLRSNPLINTQLDFSKSFDIGDRYLKREVRAIVQYSTVKESEGLSQFPWKSKSL